MYGTLRGDFYSLVFRTLSRSCHRSRRAPRMCSQRICHCEFHAFHDYRGCSDIRDLEWTSFHTDGCTRGATKQVFVMIRFKRDIWGAAKVHVIVKIPCEMGFLPSFHSRPYLMAFIVFKCNFCNFGKVSKLTST